MIAVADMAKTLRLYRDVLGFTVEEETTVAADSGLRALTNLSRAEVRRSRVQAPGSSLWIELIEYQGVERTPLSMRIQDRGAVPIPPNFNGALVADPNNFFLTLIEACDDCAPRR